MKKRRKIIFFIGILLLPVAIITAFFWNTSNSKIKTYVHFLQEFTFTGKYISDIDTVTAGAFLIFPEQIDKKNITNEDDFYKKNGITFLPLRYIPGDDKTFDSFINEEFIPQALNKDKIESSKRITTDAGYAAFEFVLTDGFEHRIINTPLAYWFSGKFQSGDLMDIVNTFRYFPNARSSRAGTIAATVDTFIERMKNASQNNTSFEKALELTTNEYQTKFSKEKVEIFKHIFVKRTYTDIDALFNRRNALVQGVFEDPESNKYTLVQITLEKKRPWRRWKITSFKMHPDALGLPATRLSAQMKKIPK